MKNFLFIILFIFSVYTVRAQPKTKEKKYPSLLWEISGNGLKKPSYLIGTMHVSNKLAFNLSDSFYNAIKNAQVVALETNPETWQEDMSKYEIDENDNSTGNKVGSTNVPDDYLSINTLKFYKYETKIERSLYSNPSTINNLLYRSYGNESSDFEEDTYLDMYIFQCGKKWKKKITGVENYGESMKLMVEAYRDAAKDKNRKERSFGDADENYSTDKLEAAYSTGNLDLLDSINKYNSYSAAFDEKFLYRRNELQANSIDSILKSGVALFAGVGAAHLPGNRGVIELLRIKGYQLRPVKMGERASKAKEQLDKIRVPLTFRTETADDGLFKVDIPGKFYKVGEDPALNQKQYADMSNGSYYMVTRIMTNAWMWSNTIDDVIRKVDSLLYENVPGKIISKSVITKNGYKGFDIVNRTRRGDIQRYNIFITPFEVVFFKMGGNGDYVKFGDEAKRFFGSIQFKENKSESAILPSAWKKYSPPSGGFAVELPHDPYIGNDGSWLYDAADKSTGSFYRVIKTDIHIYNFIEEDSFDLGLMEESFMASDFIDKQIERRYFSYKNYPALDAKFKDKYGNVYLTRFIIQGPHYYTLVAYGAKEIPAMKEFLNSFELKPFVYGKDRQQKDTSLYFIVSTPVYPKDEKIKLSIPAYNWYSEDDGYENTEDDLIGSGIFRNKTISNDTTGEKIYVSFLKLPVYYYTKDSAALLIENKVTYLGDTNWIVKFRKKTDLPNKMKMWESIISDSGSSRILWLKSFYKDGIGYTITTLSDSISRPGPFIKKFFETFMPVDTLQGINPFVKKANLFFTDFANKVSILHKRAVKHINDIEVDSTDLSQLKNLIYGLNWQEKNYLAVKKSLINKLGNINSKESSDILNSLFYSFNDTIQLQYAALESLLQHKTLYAYNLFRDIMNTEPPVLENDDLDYSSLENNASKDLYESGSKYDDGKFLDELSDSLQLTKTILPALLPLLNLDDYKKSIMQILGNMIDSNLITTADYGNYFEKFLIEAKQILKKQSIAEKKKSIEKAEGIKTGKKESSDYDDSDNDEGNEELSLYATLLLPFWEKNTAVPSLFQEMLRSNDRRVKYNTLMLLLDHDKPYPDSMFKNFAGMDDYRYELYADLKRKNKLYKFPSLYKNHLDLGKSALLQKKLYNKPDSLIFLDRLRVEFKNIKGFIYFYKYKEKKDDLTWKLAAVGLVPEHPVEFVFDDTLFRNMPLNKKLVKETTKGDNYDFTEFIGTKLNEEQSIEAQLNLELKKLIYSRRKSAKNFYEDKMRN
jgi:uncharacterized protein YbaP (TraB family)